MVNLGPEAWDPNFIEASDFGGPTPLQTAIQESPLFKQLHEHESAKPLSEREPTTDGPPICARCRKLPNELDDLIEGAAVEEMSVEDYAKDDGTYSAEHNMFLCDSCYIVLNMPTRAMVKDYMESIN